MGWQPVAAVLGGLVLVWVALVAALYWAGRKQDGPAPLKEMLRLVPDILRMCRALATDPELPRGVRIRMGLLLGYLLMPIDLVPDFVPVLGYADDAVVVALALRSVVRRAGAEALTRHWPGDPAGLEVVSRLAGVRPAPSAGA
jgi:uncharacterized membrane protein YkvA (DUF1232 family)